MILKAEQEKQKLKFELSEIIDKLETEERDIADTMDVGTLNVGNVWRFTNEREVARLLVFKINLALKENFVLKSEVNREQPTIINKI